MAIRSPLSEYFFHHILKGLKRFIVAFQTFLFVRMRLHLSRNFGIKQTRTND